MGTHTTKLRSLAVGLALLLVSALGFQNCGKFTTQSFKDSFTSLCAGQSITKLKAFAASAPLAHVNCEKPEDYRCVARVFRPGVGNGKSEKRQCTSSGCFDVQVISFDTNAALKTDDLPAHSFDEGGEYNHEIFECIHKTAQVDGLSLLTAEAATLDEAFQSVRRACEKRTQNAN